MILDLGQPIDEAVQALDLTEAERAAILALPGVWTLGDLQHVEIEDKKLAKKLKDLLS